ncbi:MAG TPA: site-specific integrase [Longimicrobiales bacterium]|nr:site-specific integrase [Longimicrobiales bacterium]
MRGAGADLLLARFEPDRPAAAPRNARAVVAAERLRGITLLLEFDATDPAWPAWRDFLDDYAEHVRALDAFERATFCVLLTGPHDPTKSVPNLLYWRYLAATGATTHTEGTWLQLWHIDFERAADSLVPCYVHGTKSQFRPRTVDIDIELANGLRDHAQRRGIGVDRPIFAFPHKAYLDVWHGILNLIRADRPTGWEEIARSMPYDLRHSSAVNALRSGVDLLQLRDLMCHADISTTQLYARRRESPRAALAAYARALRR